MEETKKIFILKIVIAVAVVGGVAFLAVKKYQASRQKHIAEDNFKSPPLLDTRKTFQITSVNKNFYKAKGDGGQEVIILIPKGVTPNFVGSKNAKVGYYVELFKYREVSNGIIAQYLNISATDPHKQFALAAFADKRIGGKIMDITKDGFTVAYAQPGGQNGQTYKVKVSAKTVFTKIDAVSTIKETRVGFSSLSLNQSVLVHYANNSADIQADKVEILSAFQLPIGSAKK